LVNHGRQRDHIGIGANQVTVHVAVLVLQFEVPQGEDLDLVGVDLNRLLQLAHRGGVFGGLFAFPLEGGDLLA
jgi:hypothetical protein